MIEAKQKGRIRELLYMTQYWLDVSQLQLQAQFLLILSLTPLEKIGEPRPNGEPSSSARTNFFFRGAF
jgi:hypothetical protein